MVVQDSNLLFHYYLEIKKKSQIVSQHNARNYVPSKVNSNLKWTMYAEPIPTVQQVPVNNKIPLELYSLLKDTTDYAWYTTR